jgi:hypothetical protein
MCYHTMCICRAVRYSHDQICKKKRKISFHPNIPLTLLASMAALQGPAGFADDGHSVLERQIELDATESVMHHENDTCRLLEAYEIERTAARILEGNYERVSIDCIFVYIYKLS